jgi:spore coat polysaccharide biosynthesis protein SpsF (cytidylyltransferase family)
MTVAVIVQARMGSSRLPGKVLAHIGEKPALLWCLDRCRDIAGVDAVVCAVPDSRADDEVAEVAADAGYFVTRGSETDVLARYAKAAREIGATTVLRVTSDCPFIDPQIAAQVLQLLTDSNVDYAANNLPPKFPHGLDCEAFAADLLYAAEEQAKAPYEREHVTPWIRTHPAISKANLCGPGGGLEELRWTLDQSEDLVFFQELAEAYGANAQTASAAELVAFCLRRPDISDMNQMHVDRARLQAIDRAPLQTAPSRLFAAA